MADREFLDTLELSVRCSNVLRSNDITTPQMFYNLTRQHFLSLKGAGPRTWREVADLQEIVRRETRKDTVIGRAAALVHELNRLPLHNEGFFLTKDRLGRLRIARFITGEDLDG